jgi:DNA helicase-2/ATP-dependent DNA helicase PcrA
MDYLEHLNPSQREGVVNTEGPTMLIAGAGSGKTGYSPTASPT